MTETIVLRYPDLDMELISDIHPEDLHEYRQYVKREARMIHAIANVEQVFLPEILKVMNISENDFKQFQAGRLSLTGWEFLALSRRLNVPPQIFQDLAAGCSEQEYKEYYEWVRAQSKWKEL